MLGIGIEANDAGFGITASSICSPVREFGILAISKSQK
jgi:hypothetical protein